ncbi:MAG TPA: dihydrodipicolinate synthase family protein [Casimicrobiaceae bacterium]|nr:dihydrodipicolinate synthase family protein [Casimicrobiaceae bacterium]
MRTINLPDASGQLTRYVLHGNAAPHAASVRPRWNRVAFAAAHVVSDPLANVDPWLATAVDWDATLAYRRYLWAQGFGVAEAMDTAQRGMGLDWPASRELIGRSVAEARGVPGAVVFSGAGTDQLAPDPDGTPEDVIAAYRSQCEAIERLGGRIILMASRALAARARSADDYVDVYSRVLAGVSQPVILHWLGEMFDPALAGYWVGAAGRGNDPDHARAMDVCANVVAANAAKIDGIKISLLDADKEIALRARLPAGVRMYTGDDFNFAALIGGDARGHSDALLGIFDAIAPAASAALTALANGDRTRFDALLAPTVPLSRHVFAAPTRFYKTGVVFMAWLNGHQSHFTMVGGQQSARSLPHLAELFRLADAADLLRDPDLAAARMRMLLAIHGIE